MTGTIITAEILAFVQGRFPQAELFAMELVMFIEKEFAITIPNDELRIDNFRTAAAMTDLVTRQRSAVPVG